MSPVRLAAFGIGSGGRVSESGYFAVDTEELRGQGGCVVRIGDEVEAAAQHPALVGRNQYGDDALVAAAVSVDERFAYLVRGLGAEIADLGVEMRSAAYHIEEMEAMNADGFNQVMPY